MSDAMLAHLIRPTVTQMMPERKPDKAVTPHPALLRSSGATNHVGCDAYASYPAYSDSNDAQTYLTYTFGVMHGDFLTFP
ncbi:hypothetical protein [Escherichia albertii]|uniref:hypothetical protein n=2 Tax=Escherichia albertii TaxID=208962 RepID=UPI00098CB88B|nr:hypothetical protein [Escherichia albertii]MCZ8857861.1 hypothetical protein [Escherichia albertii]MCZ9077957.1 hypothetical protein [Escherichia albertii]WDB82541.1 hypothetical protein PS033_16375 [Escherichia albertii]